MCHFPTHPHTYTRTPRARARTRTCAQAGVAHPCTRTRTQARAHTHTSARTHTHTYTHTHTCMCSAVQSNTLILPAGGLQACNLGTLQANGGFAHSFMLDQAARRAAGSARVQPTSPGTNRQERANTAAGVHHVHKVCKRAAGTACAEFGGPGGQGSSGQKDASRRLRLRCVTRVDCGEQEGGPLMVERVCRAATGEVGTCFAAC